MATYPVYPATTFTQAVELTIFASNQLHDVINGDALTTVETENGDIPTLRKALVDNFYFKTPINWAEGESATVFNQLYYFDGTLATSGWYYAPQATLDNPIAMGSTPLDNDNWRLYQTAKESIPAQVYPWYTEITQVTSSIVPPYEFDTAIVTYNSAVLVPGKDYTITNNTLTFTPALVPEPDAEVPDILFCYIGKVQEGNPNTNYVTYSSLAAPTAANLIGTSSGSTVQDELDDKANSSDLLSKDLNLGTSLVTGARRYFKVTDYPNGEPNTTVSKASSGAAVVVKGTDNTQAFISAITDAQKVNGIVLVPAPENGYAYLVSSTLYPVVSSGSLWRGASIQGEGKFATKIVYDGGDSPCIHVKGTSGWPTNITLSGISLYTTNDLVGEAWKIQGVTGVNLRDFAAYRFGTNLSFSNGSASGVFTEFAHVEDGWLENGATNIKFRRDSGDTSFHGINFKNIISNNLTGQTGLDIGTGCVIYNADWNQVTFFGPSGVQLILNNGSRNGNETLYFESDGTITNNGSWVTSGYWRVQNSTGSLTDTSSIPFTTETYITPTSPLDTNFSASGLSTVSATSPNISNQMYRNIVRLYGNNAQGIGIVGYDSGIFENQGLAILSQSSGDTIKDLIMRYVLHLNGMKSYRPSWNMSYGSGATQLAINSTGRHTGIMGRRTTGSITANASAQTITTDLVLPVINQSFIFSVHVYAATSERFISTYVGAGVTGSVGSVAVLLNSISNPAISIPTAGIKILDGGTVQFTITTTLDVTYDIKVLGVGTY